MAIVIWIENKNSDIRLPQYHQRLYHKDLNDFHQNPTKLKIKIVGVVLDLPANQHSQYCWLTDKYKTAFMNYIFFNFPV